MSRMIQCDGCKKTMYEDSRSEKGAYHELWIDNSYLYHVCKDCFELMMTEILHQHWNKENYQWEDDK